MEEFRPENEASGQRSTSTLAANNDGGESSPSSFPARLVPPRYSTVDQDGISNETSNILELRAQIREMSAFIQSQRDLAGTLGLSDEPVPGYTSTA